MNKMFLRLLLIFYSLFAVSTLSAEMKLSIDDSPLGDAQAAPVLSYADTLDKATPSVVAVYTSRMVTLRQSPHGMSEMLRQFGFRVPQPPQQNRQPQERREQLGVGSGVIVSVDGYVITNHHVIAGDPRRQADQILVRLNDGTEYEAELVGSDQKTDVAVLKIDSDDEFPAVVVADSDTIRVGDVVFAIGNPLDVGLTATQGIVSATGRDSFGILGPGAYENFIQTDASINKGNSGGALIDARGRLVGINTAIVSGTGGSIGIGFAIPVNMAVNVARSLIETGGVPRGMLGLIPGNLTRELSEAFGLESTKGALVNQVQEGSPADKAGIQHGDVITYVDDMQIESAPQLRLTVSQMAPGSEVKVTLVRGGETMEVMVTLGSLNGVPIGSNGDFDNSVMGAKLETLNDDLRESMSIPENISGVVVVDIEPDSPFADKVESPMVILEVNGRKVSTPEDVANLLKEGFKNRLYVWMAGQRGFIVLKL